MDKCNRLCHRRRKAVNNDTDTVGRPGVLAFVGWCGDGVLAGAAMSNAAKAKGKTTPRQAIALECTATRPTDGVTVGLTVNVFKDAAYLKHGKRVAKLAGQALAGSLVGDLTEAEACWYVNGLFIGAGVELRTKATIAVVEDGPTKTLPQRDAAASEAVSQ